jgi:hypothetical protein
MPPDPCPHCDEPIHSGEETFRFANGPVAHVECAIRMLFGSVGHQQRACPCYGGRREDSSGLTKRQAAWEALAFFRANQDDPQSMRN